MLIKIASRALTVVSAVGRFLGLGLEYGLGRPAQLLWRVVFRIVLLPLYRPYVRIKQRLVKHPAFAEIENVGHFLQRYSLYAILVIIGVTVAGNNIFARTIRPDEIGQGAIWTSFVVNENSTMIVETGPAKKIVSAPLLAVGRTSVTAAAATTTPTTTDPENPQNVAVGQTHNTDADTGLAPITRTDTVTYTVVAGDTISTIASAFGVSSRTVLWANNMSATDYIKPGQQLKIPPQSGYLYTVQKGDTLASIAQKYKGVVDEILTANQLADASSIAAGDEIIIPNGEPPAPPAPVITAPKKNTIGSIFTRNDSTIIPPSAPSGSGKFIWPTTSHKINQYYRGSYHTGVDIAGNYSSPIYAAASGTVIYAQFDRSGYGLHIIIDHGNGYWTLYGHSSKIFVHVGEHVSQGQTIAMIGSTGHSTGPHLHFEIRPCGSYSCFPFLNPLSFF